jgi:membrane associated rhomboid family serine protease
LLPLTDRDIPRHTTPYVVYALVGVNALVALITLLLLSDLAEFRAIYRFGVVPDELTGGELFGLVTFRGAGGALQQIDLTSPIPTLLTMFTSMFLHGGWMHLGGNMLFLWVFGDNIEDKLGHVRFLVFYLLAGSVAVWAQVGVDPSSQIPMIGASGAVAGVLGAYLVLHPRSRIDTLVMVGFIFHARLPAFVLLGGWAIFQVFVGAASLGVSGEGGVAYFAHVGGFAMGAVVLLLLRAGRQLRWEDPRDLRRDYFDE